MRMKILVIGDLYHFEECRQKLGAHRYTHLKSRAEAEKILMTHEVIFDFLIDEAPGSFGMYADKPVTVFFNTCKISLAEITRFSKGDFQCKLFGFNGMPTLFNRKILELCLLKSDDTLLLQRVCDELNTEYSIVDDRVGMVTPRVICMIINEAYFTVQEGTASREDIDLAMKLGTNYPYGPFEWCQKIGIKNVYELLEALFRDTKDERYKISALLKKEYLKVRV